MISVIKGEYHAVDEDLLFWLEIPGIDLKEKVYTMNSTHNFVDQHIQILKNSVIDDYFFLLAGHSGYGSASYFNDLKYVEVGDFIFIILENQSLCYIVEEIYYISKNGYFFISSVEFKNTLYLITCSLDYPSKQLVVMASLVDSLSG